jgi:heme-degrading monooxygenase HmoA
MTMIAFRIRFAVRDGIDEDFVEMIQSRYRPGLERQPGFLGSRLLRTYDDGVAEEIGATTDGVDYVLEFEFESEADRVAWVASPEHDPLWQAAVSMTDSQRWCGFDVLDAGESA